MLIRRLVCITLISVLLVEFQITRPNAESILFGSADTACRFGITSPYGSEGYDIPSLQVGSYLDWMAISNPTLPEGVEYIRVLRLRDDLYPQTLASLPGWIEQNPGSVWVIGNEPDTTYEDQDALLAEHYAQRFYELARIIRNNDPSARIAFGSIVQPTSIRLRYLDRAWLELVAEAGDAITAARLIDILSIHSFILNEQPGSWGTGVPPGFENDYGDAEIITNLDDTYSIDIFEARVVNFRSWMSNHGLRDKPLWITEYGSLLPPIDPPGGPNYYNVSDQDTASFMIDTFDFLLSATDDQTGYSADGKQLVQRWFWYSLNDYRYNFGGSLFDPDNGNEATVVGESFRDYQATNIIQPDLYPESLSITPISYNHDRSRVNYRLEIVIGNSIFPDATCAQVWIFDDNPEEGGELISGPIPASRIQSNYGSGRLELYWNDVQPLTEHHLYVQVLPVGISDFNPNNNMRSFEVYTELPKLWFLPTLQR